jgi:hypothetical protein
MVMRRGSGPRLPMSSGHLRTSVPFRRRALRVEDVASLLLQDEVTGAARAQRVERGAGTSRFQERSCR